MHKLAYITAAENLRKNDAQWQAYESKGNCVILAGPGSGKTKTLTIKMARMLAEDVNYPRGIACITYNNQCARELRKRLSALGVEDGRRASIGTLHSFCLQHIVMPYARLAGELVPNPLKVAIADERDECYAHAVERCLGDNENPTDWGYRCDTYRRTHLDRDVAEWSGDDGDAARVVEMYERTLHSKGLIDFDGMVLMGLRLVVKHEWIRRALRSRFPIFVVDEYQDLGHALHRIVEVLCFRAGLRLLAVGDPDQSIYGFNGADPSLLTELSEREGVEKVHLKLNYRCGDAIIKASETALGESRGFKSGSDEVGNISIHARTAGLQDQVAFVCDTIIPDALRRRAGRKLGDVAVLYRSQYDGDDIARAVEQRGWKFIRIDQGNPYPRSPMIFWLEDCAAWSAGGWEHGMPRLSELVSRYFQFNESVTSESERLQLQRSLVKFLYGHRESARPLREWLAEFENACLEVTLDRETRLRDEKENLATLAKVCATDGRLAAFTVSSFAGQGGCGDHVNLMTLHSAKGLEFDVVAMIGLEEGVLPHYKSTSELKLREERRLFYVGLTRARHEVHLLYSGWYRTKWGVKRNGKSRFLQDLEATQG